MRKLRIVILSFASFSLFVTLFFYLGLYLFDVKYDYYAGSSGEIKYLYNAMEIPLSANVFVIAFIFIATLIWFIYHRKDRAESITNVLIFLLYAAYLVMFILGAIKLGNVFYTIKEEHAFNSYGNLNIWNNCSLLIFVITGMWLVLAFIPVSMHCLASICTGGFDNVGEPDNIYGFMFTLIGICYLGTIIATSIIYQEWNLRGFDSEAKTFLKTTYILGENGLLYAFIILTFILCAGLKFNFVTLNIFNISMNYIFVIAWVVICIINRNDGLKVYYSLINLIALIPMSVLSIFVFRHFILIDRFYKGRTKNFLND